MSPYLFSYLFLNLFAFAASLAGATAALTTAVLSSRRIVREPHRSDVVFLFWRYEALTAIKTTVVCLAIAMISGVVVLDTYFAGTSHAGLNSYGMFSSSVRAFTSLVVFLLELRSRVILALRDQFGE